jgi:hypothetical protein
MGAVSQFGATAAILDAPNGPIWVDIEHFAGTPATDLAEARQLVDSIVFTP